MKSDFIKEEENVIDNRDNIIRNKSTVDIRYHECPLPRTFTISNSFFGSFSISSNFPYHYIRYLKPCYLELSLCQTNVSALSALLSRCLELFHLDVRLLKKIVRKIRDSIECLSFCVHL